MEVHTRARTRPGSHRVPRVVSSVFLVLAALSFIAQPAPASAVSLEAGVYPISESWDDDIWPAVEGDIAVWRTSWSDGYETTYRDEWSQLSSGDSGYLDYSPWVYSGPQLYAGEVYSIAPGGLRISSLSSADSTTVPASMHRVGPLVMSDDGLATWSFSLLSAGIFDAEEQTMTVVPYAQIPRLESEKHTPTFIQPMASSTRLVIGGDWVQGYYMGPVSIWDRVFETRTVMGKSYFRPPTPRWQVITPQYFAWADTTTGYRVHVHEFASNETTVIAGSVPDANGSMDMSGTRIVWSDGRHGNADIYWYDVATDEQRRLTSDKADQVDPSIDGDRVVWSDERRGDWDIYGTDVVPGSPNDVVPPVTTIETTKNSDGSVSASLSATDAAGVAATYYSVDSEDWESGTSFTIDEPGVHYIEYRSEDTYGNIEGERQISITVTTPTTVRLQTSCDLVRWSGSVDITVSVEATGLAEGPLENGNVRVERRTAPAGAWTTLDTITTDASGTATCSATPDVATQYRAVFDGDPAFADAGQSAPVLVDVTSTTSLTAAASNTRPAYAAATAITGKLGRFQGAVTPCSTETVTLQRQSGAVWVKVAGASTHADGSYAFTVRPTVATTYRVVFDGVDRLLDPSTSAPVKLVPGVFLGTPVAPSVMKMGRYYTVYGSLQPKHSAGSKPVRVYRWRKVSGRWRSYGYVTATAYDDNGYTRYKVRARLTRAGKWRLRAYAPADSLHTATWSGGYDYVTVK